MEMMPINRVDLAAPLNTAANSPELALNDRQVISAVGRLNEAAWLGQDRELTYRRDQHTGRLVIQIRDRQSGDVVDQIPPESVVKLLTQLQQELNAK